MSPRIKLLRVSLQLLQQLHQKVAAVSFVEKLREEVKVGDKRGLQDDRDIGGVEQLDGVAAVLSSVPGALDG